MVDVEDSDCGSTDGVVAIRSKETMAPSSNTNDECLLDVWLPER